MWSDELDNKMRETTEGSHTAYEERAWVKMEELLDKHLPQKRRRFIPLLLLPLAIIAPFPEDLTQGTNSSEVEVKESGTTNKVNRPELNAQAAAPQKKRDNKS